MPIGSARRLTSGTKRRLADAGLLQPEPPGTGLIPLERTPSLTARVYRSLCDSIVTRQLAPDQPLVIEQVAVLLGVSRTPVREALAALIQNGLVRELNGGYRVAPLDATYVREVYAVRSALESLAAEVVAPQLSDDDLAALRDLVSQSAGSDSDYAQFIGPALAFHDYLRSKCPLPYLDALIDTVHTHRSRLVQLEHHASEAYWRDSYAEHRAILAALERRDGKRARRLMEEHLDRIGEAIAALVKRQQRGERRE